MSTKHHILEVMLQEHFCACHHWLIMTLSCPVTLLFTTSTPHRHSSPPITSFHWLEDEEDLKMKGPIYQLNTSYADSDKFPSDWRLLYFGLSQHCTSPALKKRIRELASRVCCLRWRCFALRCRYFLWLCFPLCCWCRSAVPHAETCWQKHWERTSPTTRWVTHESKHCKDFKSWNERWAP